MAEIVSLGVRRAARDDSCLFSAVRAAVGDDDDEPRRRRCCARAETPADALRRRCAEYVGARPKRFDEAALGMPNAAYRRWIARRKNWGGEVELVALSELLRVDIAVWSPFRSDEALVYRSPAAARGLVHLLYSGTHYDALVGRTAGGATVSLFPAGGDAAAELEARIKAHLAGAIARAATTGREGATSSVNSRPQ
jgi:ubiquitin thioesterase OTU1